jgi:hypothetical protein
VGVAWSCTGAHGDGPVSRECRGEPHVRLKEPQGGREQIGEQGKEE